MGVLASGLSPARRLGLPKISIWLMDGVIRWQEEAPEALLFILLIGPPAPRSLIEGTLSRGGPITFRSICWI